MKRPRTESRSANPAAPRSRSRLPVALAVALLGAPGAHALTTDREQPINIEADRAEADDARRVTIYRGDVIITQGTLRIEGDTVTIHYDDDNAMTKLVTLGGPARFRQLPDDVPDLPKNYRIASAKRMEYYADKDLIVLLGTALYGQGGDRVAADRIVYDSRNSRMKAEANRPASTAPAAGSAEPARSRVKIKILPKKND